MIKIIATRNNQNGQCSCHIRMATNAASMPKIIKKNFTVNLRRIIEVLCYVL